jgi:hAT family C-terminal dimerisation region
MTLQVKAEIENYRKRHPLTHTEEQHGNPLEWWAGKEASLPILASFAKEMLAIPATSAASERVFSQAGQITRANRNRLDVTNTAQLVFLKGSWAKVLNMAATVDEADEEWTSEDQRTKRARALTF